MKISSMKMAQIRPPKKVSNSTISRITPVIGSLPRPVSTVTTNVRPVSASVTPIMAGVNPVMASMNPITSVRPIKGKIHKGESGNLATPAGLNQPRMAWKEQGSPTSNTSRNSTRVVRLKVEPFVFMSMLEWECIQEFNEHGTLRVTGMVSEEHAAAYHQMSIQDTWVHASGFDEQDNECTVFQGVLTDLSIESRHQVHTMSIEVKTGSYLLDQSYHIRSFQDAGASYEAVIRACLRRGGGQFMMRERQNALIERMVVQYQETDWEFIKRMAYRVGLVLLPEVRTSGKKFYMGLNRSASAREIVSESFHFKRTAHEKYNLAQSELGVMEVHTREVHQLGDTVLFMGKRMLIGKVESRLEGAELWHDYTLFVPKQSFTVNQFNHKMSGTSLKANVTGVRRDQVQVSIQDDENRKHAGSRWFDYATVYSSPDGTGWYAMPEVGDEVRVIFPVKDESRAYVVSSVHLDADRRGRTNPDHKSFRNRQNKEILFTPNRLVLTNNNGLSIELSDADGIRINSNRSIMLRSDQSIQMDSQGSNISLFGGDSISVQQGAAQIQMQNAINVAGGKIKMN